MRPPKACFWILTLAALAVLSAVPVSAGELPAPAAPQAVTEAPAPTPADCGFNLETVLPGKTSVCPAPQTAAVLPALPGLNGAPAPEFMALRRTCRCSCGFPCKTDADCGPGGICGAGITCC